MGTHDNGRPDRTPNPFAYYAVRKPVEPHTPRLPEPPVPIRWR